MAITLNGSTGIGTPGVSSTDAITGTTGAFSGNVTANGLSTELRPLVLGTSQASTSGTAIDFTGIPSWAKRVTVMFQGVSLSGTDDLLVQVGTSGGVVTTGYSSGSTRAGWSATSTAGFVIAVQAAAGAFSGVMTVTNLSGNAWVAEMSGFISGPTYFYGGGGDVTLGAALDRVRITRTGSNTFDAGTINIIYE